MVNEIFSAEDAEIILNKILSSKIPGIGDEIYEKLRELGHDGIIASYSDGTQEIIAFTSE